MTTTFDGLGRLVEMTDEGPEGLGTTTHTYDAEGRLTVRSTPQGELRYSYEQDTGRMASVSTANGTRTEYGYDVLGRMTTATAIARFGQDLPGAGEVTRYVYDDSGAIDYEIGPNGVTRDNVFDSLGRTIGIDQFQDANGDGVFQPGEVLISQFTYAYDAFGNRLTSTETLAAGTADEVRQTFTYRYDGLNRLVEETLTSGSNPSRDYTHTFRFDLNSNRVAWEKDAGSDGTIDETVAYGYDANDRLRTETSSTNGETTYTWGENNLSTYQTEKLTADGTRTTQTYDVMGRLATVTIDASSTGGAVTTESYTYGTDGIRASRTVDGETTVYLYDGMNPTGYAQVLEQGVDDDGDRKLQQGEVDLTFTNALDVVAQAAIGEALHLVYDVHGSNRGLTDAGGRHVAEQAYSFDAYGNALGFDSAEAKTSLGYHGELRVGDTGSIYLRGRDNYRPEVGRFEQGDPFAGAGGSPLSFNRHGFTHANPISSVDPSGQYSLLQVSAGFAIGLNVAAVSSGIGVAYSYGVNPKKSISSAAVPAADLAIAHLAADAYNESSAGFAPWRPLTGAEIKGAGFVESELDASLGDGFQARLYRNGSTGETALMFAGTNPLSLGDWHANLGQGIAGGYLTSQYRRAALLGRQAAVAFGPNQVIFGGHSLGGGLASFAAADTSSRAFTFNAAGLNYLSLVNGATPTGSEHEITAYSVSGDILTGIQDFSVLPSSVGQRYVLEPASQDRSYSPLTPINLHLMDAMIRAMGGTP